jgi:succinate dehydrogenase / fumarate reductase iron-sulfur subunit
MAKMKIRLKVWRQNSSKSAVDSGRFEDYSLDDVNSDMSFLEMLDFLNEDLTRQGKIPV